MPTEEHNEYCRTMSGWQDGECCCDQAPPKDEIAVMTHGGRRERILHDISKLVEMRAGHDLEMITANALEMITEGIYVSDPEEFKEVADHAFLWDMLKDSIILAQRMKNLLNNDSKVGAETSGRAIYIHRTETSVTPAQFFFSTIPKQKYISDDWTSGLCTESRNHTESHFRGQGMTEIPNPQIHNQG